LMNPEIADWRCLRVLARRKKIPNNILLHRRIGSPSKSSLTLSGLSVQRNGRPLGIHRLSLASSYV